MEAPDQLLLSKAVCRKLGIIRYHPNVKPLDVEKSETAKQLQKSTMRLVQTVRLPAQHMAVMPIKLMEIKVRYFWSPIPGWLIYCVLRILYW